MMSDQRVLLLLSGGKDSAHCAEILQQHSYLVVGLCISGKQKVEEPGAHFVAQKLGIKLIVVPINFFDELTWNPIKLIFRDILMGLVAIYFCKKLKINKLATGVKSADLANPKLFWLRYFIKFSGFTLDLFKIKLLFPLSSDEFRK